MSWWRRLWALVRSDRLDQDLDEELDTHLAMRAEAHRAAGASDEDARLAAARQFGGRARIKEQTRDRDILPWFDSIGQDARYAARQLRRSPGFAAAAILTLAFAIGATAAVFTILNAVLLAPPPFRDPDRLVRVWEEPPNRPGQRWVVGPTNFVRWRARVSAFDGLTAFVEQSGTLTGGGEPEEVTVHRVTDGFFETLGVAPVLGRTFSATEYASRQPAGIVIGYGLWQRRFGGDPAIVGRTIQFAGVPQTVLGVMPRDFGNYLKYHGLVGPPPEVWMQYVMPPAVESVFVGRALTVLGRLRAGVSIAQAQAEVASVSAALTADFPERNRGWTSHVGRLQDEQARPYRRELWLFAAAVGFGLLIACANVATLILARNTSRTREIAVRLALGAGRARVARQLLTEALVLSAAGAALGLAAARAALHLLVRASAMQFLQAAPPVVDARALAFTLATAVATALVCGVAPMIDGARSNPRLDLQGLGSGSAPGRGRVRTVFVAVDLALAIVLLVGTGLLIRSARALAVVDPGFHTANILTMRIQLPPALYREEGRRVQFFESVRAGLSQLSGVVSAGSVCCLPFSGVGNARAPFTLDGNPGPGGEPESIDISVASSGYFDTIGLRLQRGRFFTAAEQAERSGVALVNESFVRTYSADRDAIGRHLAIALGAGTPAVSEIVGIVADIRHDDLVTPVRPTVYWPYAQYPYTLMTVVVRTAGDPIGLTAAAGGVVHAVDPNQPVSEVRTMADWLAETTAPLRFDLSVLSVFSLFALVLAAIGVYSVAAYHVRASTREIGIRLAVGAGARDILRLIARNELRVAGLGLVAGLAGAGALSRTISAFLFQTSPLDPFVFVGAAIVLGSVTVVALAVPAWRALRLAPVDALREP